MKRYFEFQDAKSYKFWQAELADATLTVTYGKIGTTGQEKVTPFGSAAEAEKEMTKLINEKTKKGYVEKTEASAKKVTKRIAVSHDEAEDGKTLADKLEAFLATPQAAEVDALTLGSWEEAYQNSPNEAIDLLVQEAAKLPKLKELLVGDMDSEECEISWIFQTKYTGILKAFPQLESLTIQGSCGLDLGKIDHPALKTLTITCGGLPKDVIASIAEAKLPALESLSLYLGVEDYGFDGSLKDLEPFFEKGRFPRLKRLGLMDSEIADEIAVAIAKAPVLEQLEVLDLSMGTLTDVGGEALLAGNIHGLKELDLEYHYLSDEMMKKFKALPIKVNVSDQQTADDDDYRYPAVTE